MKRLKTRPEGIPRQPNFLTPEVIGYWRIGQFVAELSSGEGFERGTTIYGVTVSPDPTRKVSKGGFRTKTDAMDYMESLDAAESEVAP